MSRNRDGSEVPSLSFNETWFLALDTAIATANTLGIRLILPLINMIDNPGVRLAAHTVVLEDMCSFDDLTTDLSTVGRRRISLTMGQSTAHQILRQ